MLLNSLHQLSPSPTRSPRERKHPELESDAAFCADKLLFRVFERAGRPCGFTFFVFLFTEVSDQREV